MKFGGGKDRYILFPQGFRLVLKSYRNANQEHLLIRDPPLRGFHRKACPADRAALQRASVARRHPHFFRH